MSEIHGAGGSMTTTALLTAAEFALLPEDRRRELVAGEVVEYMPPGGKHGAIAARLAARLILWAGSEQSGYVGVESGFTLAEDPDTVRSPDVAYVSPEHIPSDGIPEGFWRQAPDLAVEVISPSETAEEIRAKIRDYLAAGTTSVWVVYPRTREIVVHTADGFAQTFGLGMQLTSPLLPGFALLVDELLQ